MGELSILGLYQLTSCNHDGDDFSLPVHPYILNKATLFHWQAIEGTVVLKKLNSISENVYCLLIDVRVTTSVKLLSIFSYFQQVQKGNICGTVLVLYI